MGRRSPLQSIGRSIRNLVANQPPELDPLAAYELWAASYDNTDDNAVLHLENSIIRPLLEHAGLKGQSVLDAGCGTGRHFDTIQNAGPRELTAIDLSPAMLQRAKGKISPNIPSSLQVASVEHLPFRNGLFDFVLSTLVLGHVENLSCAIAELSRVTRPGGALLISCFHPFGKLLSWKRSFQATDVSGRQSWFAAKYYLHLYSDYFNALKSARVEILQIHEPVVDESIKPFYERTGRPDLFDTCKGYPLLLIFLARKL